MKKRLALLGLMLVLMIPVGLLGLMSSSSGSRWLLQAVLPAQVSVENIEGRLLDRITLTGLRYESDTETVAVNKLVFTWQPSQLFSGVFKIIDVTANNININLTETTQAEPGTFDLNAELLLPLQIAIENLLLTNLTIQQGEQRQHLQKLQLSAFTEQGRLNIVSLSVNAEPAELTAQGQMGLGKGFPLHLTADWQVATADNGLWQAVTTINGDLRQLAFDSRLASPFTLTLKGQLDDLQGEPKVNLRGDWQKLNWPPTGDAPQVSSEQGNFELSGLLSDYRIKLSGDLTQPYLPKAARLAFNGKGSMDALTIEKLELKSTAGALQIDGDISWKDATVFDLKAAGQDFNPAILVPELPGSLNFTARVKGQLAGEALQLDADISKLTGKLRGYPVSANGKLFLAGEQLKVDALKLVSGANKIAVNGTLGQEQAELDLAIDAPKLESLWPGLGGSLKGDGHLQGPWKNPSVKFQASGKRLRFSGHRAERLAIDIDYQADGNKTSNIQLSVRAIKTGTTQIEKLLIDGFGTVDQHRFNADIRSSYGDVSTALTGRLQGDVWQGDFFKLDVNSRDFGRWQLSNNMLIRIEQSPVGIDARLSETCLTQQAAAICLQGRYPANGDFGFKAKATNVPTSLMQAYLPEQMKITGLINADAYIQQQKGLLSGNYQLTMPAMTVTLKTKETSTKIVLGASSLSGEINGEIVSVDLNLALAAQDYVRARLQLDTGKTRALSGQVTASMAELSLLNPFVPQLSNIKGALKVDLTLTGSPDTPVANGTISFSGGAVDMTELGLEIREIKLQALAAAERIQLSGSAKSGQGFINLDGFADLQGAAEIMLNGTDFDVAKLPEAQIAVSPELKLLFADRQGKVSGRLKIPKAVFQLKDIPENAVKVSPDEVILGEQKAEKQTAAAINIDADIEVELGKQISFSGQGLQTKLSGKLKIAKSGEKTAMYGVVDMDKARYKRYGQELTVRKGRFLFNGPVDKPWLDLEAIRVSKSQDVTAILSLTGPLEAPQTRIYSEPALPEAEALAYLVTGRALNQVSKAEGNMVASAALSYGAGQVSWIADKLGVDEFEIKEGKTLQDTLATVGQYLTPDFYVGAKVGLFNKQAVLVLKRKLTKTLNVETQTGTSQRIKLNYEFDKD
ncbi:translocation/assembly module TamB domain-containing protein [Methylobacter svalbardensis]|uniref:translocation/assembly module TamB domain-containing protein n=1 Tax=Methylobacter svalbardensis TaxID=3080016 RepID=UPI0030EFA20A